MKVCFFHVSRECSAYADFLDKAGVTKNLIVGFENNGSIVLDFLLIYLCYFSYILHTGILN